MTKVVTPETIGCWLRENGIPADGNGLDFSGYRRAFWFRIPVSVEDRTMLTTPIRYIMEDEAEVLVVIWDCYTFADDYSDPNLLMRFRQALGETTHLPETSGYLVGPEDRADLVSLIRLVLYQQWPCYVIPSSGRMYLHLAQDDSGSLGVRSDEEPPEEWVDALGSVVDIQMR